VHIVFNLLGAVVWCVFISELGALARWISPAFETLAGTERLAAETPRQIANANTIFNIANVLLLIGFTTPLARFTMWLVPDRVPDQLTGVTAKHLEPMYLESPTMALDQVQRELQHMGQLLVGMLEETPAAVIHGTEQQLNRIAQLDDDIDYLHAEILKYLRRIAIDQMRPADTARLSDLIAVANQLESIGDIAARDLVAQGTHRIEAGLSFSAETQRAFRPLVRVVVDSLRDALAAVTSGDIQLAQNVMDRKAEMQSLMRAATDHLGRRLLAQEPNRVELFRMESEVVGQSQRLFYHTRQIARIVLDQ
jgi:phosphate:Na+ symporter